MRQRVAQVDWPLPGVRRVEHVCGRNSEQDARPQGATGRIGDNQATARAAARGGSGGGKSHRHAQRRAEPRAGGRAGAGVAGAHRRRAGHRQVHPGATGGAGAAGTAHAVRVRRGEREAAEAARRAAARRQPGVLHRERDVVGTNLRAHPERAAGRGHH